MKFNGLFIILFLILNSFPGLTQDWQRVFHTSSTGKIYITDSEFDNNSNKHFVTGRFTDTLFFETNDTLVCEGSGSIFIASYDQDYNPLWIYEIDGDGYELRSNLDLDNNSNLYLSGVFTSTNCSFGTDTVLASDGIGDNFLAKFNSKGKFLWVNHIGKGASFQKNGNIMIDNSNDIIATLDYQDSIIISGKNTDTTLFSGPASSDATVAVKLDSSGVIYNNAIYNIQTDGDEGAANIFGIHEYKGNYYFSGRYRDTVYFQSKGYESTNDSYDIFLLKIENDFNDIWIRRSYGTSDDFPGTVANDQYGNVYLSGFFNSTDYHADSTETVTSEIIPNNGGRDIFILKYNKNGILQWGKSYGSTENDWSRKIIENQNILYITGYYGGDITFGDETLIHEGGEDFFVGTFDTDGNKLRAFGLDQQGSNDESGLALSVGPDNALYTGGYFKSPSIGIGDTTFNLNGTQDMFLGKFNSRLSAAFTEKQNISCHGGADGKLAVTPYFGFQPYEYIWESPLDTLTDSVATNLSAGTYTVSVTDGEDTVEVSATLTQPDSIVFGGRIEVNGDVTDSLNCYGDENGDILINPTGGTGSYDYEWTSPEESGLVLADSNQYDLSSGNFNLEITDENGCTADTTYTISEPRPVTFNETQVTHIGNFQDGAIDLSVSGGTGDTTNFGYHWDGPDPLLPADTIQDLDSLAVGGDYTAQVTDENSCTFDTSVTVIDSTEFNIYFKSEDVTHVSDVGCHGDSAGSAIVTVIEPNGTLDYTWTDSTGTDLGVNDSTITNLPAGKFYVTVQDADTSLTASVIIEQPDSLELNLNGSSTQTLDCYGDSDGKIDLEVSGGTTPYSYQWDDGTTTQDRTDLPAGTYGVTVTDDNGCSKYTTWEISQPDNPVDPGAYIDQEPLCYGDQNGKLKSEPTGGNGSPYSYQWDDPANQNTPTADGLEAGDYTVTVTDEKGCNANETITLTQPDSLSLSADITDVTCFNGSNGAINLSVSGGTTPYDYWWSTNDGSGLVETDKSQSSLTYGHYTVEVSDKNNCSKERTYLVNQPPEVTIDNINHTDVTCNGGSNGEIVVQDVSGGSGNGYEYRKDGGTWQSSNTFSNLSAGDYNMQVQDDQGCTSVITTVTINEPSALSLESSITNVSCNGSSDGSIDITVTGGTTPYDYSWSNGSSSEDLSNVPAGEYTLTATDAEGCTIDSTYTVSAPDAITFNTATTDVTCNGGEDGAITIENVSGGSGSGYEYSKDGGTSWQSSNTFSNLTAGVYEVHVKDENGCIATSNEIEITEPPQITITNVESSNIETCYGDKTGSINVEAQGGTGDLTYKLLLDGNIESQNITGDFTSLAAGIYTVQITDGNDCMVRSSEIEITQPAKINITNQEITNVECFGDSTGSIDINAEGGTGSLTYRLMLEDDNIGENDNGEFTMLESGNYELYVIDNNGCLINRKIEITEPPKIVIDNVESSGLSEAGAEDATITVDASGGTGTLYYTLNPDSLETNTTGEFTNLASGEYFVDVTDDNNCGQVSTDVIEITINASGFQDLEEEYSFNIYPNPTSGEVKVYMYFEKNVNMELEIINSLGHKVEKLSYKDIQFEWNRRMNLSSYSSGLYFVKIYIDGSYAGKANLLLQ